MDRRSEEEWEEMRMNEDEKKNEIDQLRKRHTNTHSLLWLETMIWEQGLNHHYAMRESSLSLCLVEVDTNKRPDLSPLVSYASSHWNNRKRETGLQTGPYGRRRRRCHNSGILNDHSDGEERETRGGMVWKGRIPTPSSILSNNFIRRLRAKVVGREERRVSKDWNVEWRERLRRTGKRKGGIGRGYGDRKYPITYPCGWIYWHFLRYSFKQSNDGYAILL